LDESREIVGVVGDVQQGIVPAMRASTVDPVSVLRAD
jgi:ABC-type lipoprotein release transport system permease subunit